MKIEAKCYMIQSAGDRRAAFVADIGGIIIPPEPLKIRFFRIFFPVDIPGDYPQIDYDRAYDPPSKSCIC